MTDFAVWPVRLSQLVVGPIAVFGLFSCSGAAEPSVAPSHIDISEFEPSFQENFDTLDISEWGCLSRWISHTPWAGDFGSARFMPPGEDSPFSIKDGVLTIEARRQKDGRWHSGMISSWDACNSGFAQKYGYFEIRARLPDAPGFWPSFWMIGVDKRQGTAEIDIFEFHTGEPGNFSLGLHKHPKKAGDARQSSTARHAVEPGTLSDRFNTFGVEYNAEDIVIYLNREEIWRTPTMEEFNQPMYMLASFPADISRMDDTTPDSVTMEIDYIHAYQRKPIGF